MIPISYPSPRVSSLDAGLLDTELLSLLKEQFSKIFHLHPSEWWSYNQHPELWSLILNIIIYRLTVLKTGSSYGSSLQNLKLSDSRTGALISNNKRRILLALIVGQYGYNKFVSKIFSSESSEAEKNDHNSLLGKMKASAYANRTFIITKVNNSIRILNLLNFLTFLVNGKYPSLVHRILRVTFTPIVSDLLKFNGDNISYEFQNRQLVWNVMTEFLVFVFPLFQISKLRKIARSIITANRRESSVDEKPKTTPYTHLPDSQCAICLAEKDRGRPGSLDKENSFITNPYITNCGHIYCYICIVTRFNAMDNLDDFEDCPRCGLKLKWFQEYGGVENVDESTIIVPLVAIDSEAYADDREGAADKDDHGKESTEISDNSDSDVIYSEGEEYDIEEAV